MWLFRIHWISEGPSDLPGMRIYRSYRHKEMLGHNIKQRVFLPLGACESPERRARESLCVVRISVIVCVLEFQKYTVLSSLAHMISLQLAMGFFFSPFVSQTHVAVVSFWCTSEIFSVLSRFCKNLWIIHAKYPYDKSSHYVSVFQTLHTEEKKQLPLFTSVSFHFGHFSSLTPRSFPSIGLCPHTDLQEWTWQAAALVPVLYKGHTFA